MDRKKFFQQGFKEVIKEIYKTPLGGVIDRRLQSIVNALEPFAFYTEDVKDQEKSQKTIKKTFFLRPPGSNPDPEIFLQLCTSCGDCIIACPHYTIFQIPEIRGPIINTSLKACYVCEDYPCIEACETSALTPFNDETLPYFGYAKVISERSCQNYEYKGTRKRKLNCQKCYEECPVEDAISLKKKVPEILDACIGCGVCKQVCPENVFEIVLSES